MVHQPQHIDFEDFADNVRQVFEQVRDRNEPIFVDRDGETYRLEKEGSTDIWRGYDPERVQLALKATAGILEGVDVDALIRDLDAQREQGPGCFE
jgi:hypothetical protein